MRHVKVRVFRRNPSRKRRRTTARKHRRWGMVAAHKRRVNPSRKRRRNPVKALRSLKGAFSGSTLKRAAGLGVGFIAGRQLVNLLATGTVMGKGVFTPPAFVATIRPGLGLVNIVVGVMVAQKAKGAVAKDVGMGLLASGGVDVLTTLINKAAPGMLGMWVDDPLSAFRTPGSLGMGVTRTEAAASGMGRIGPVYRVPPPSRARLAGMGGYNDSAFSDVNSAFAAG